MTNTYKPLGQVNPAATTATTLYTVPAATSAIVSSLAICNQGGAAATFRIAIRPAGAALAAQHYISYDTVLYQNDTIFMTLGITLAATDVVTVYASAGTVSFSAFGCEIS